MKDIEEIQGKASLAFITFIPTFPLTRFYVSTYLTFVATGLLTNLKRGVKYSLAWEISRVRYR